MLDIGWSELLVIAVVLIVIVGPKDLPPMIRAFGKTMASLRKMAGDFRSQFDEALKEADMDDVRQTISDVRNLNPTNSLRDAMNPLRQLGNEIKSDLQKATAAPDGLSSTPAPATGEPVAPLVSVPEPEMKLPDAPPAVDAQVAAAVAAEEKPKRARSKSIATVEAEAVADKPKRAARSKVAAAPETAATVKTSEPAALKPAVKTVTKKAAASKSSADKAAVAEAKPAKTAKTKAAKPKKDEA